MTVNVFCFPFAGGAASFYRGWPSNDLVAIQPVQLPGREERMKEKLIDRMEPLVAAIADSLRPRLGEPFALLGHSMGAMIAFELAHLLRARGLPCPKHLFVSGAPAPPRAALVTPLYDLPEEQLIDKLREFNGVPDEVLAHSELMTLLMPRFRADFAVTGTYRYADRPPLTCPITAFGGADDHVAAPEQLDEWRGFTVASFRREVFPGGHFFLSTAAPKIFNQLVQSLASNPR